MAPAAGTQRRRAAGPGHWAGQTPRGTHATHVAVPPQAFLSPPAARSRPRQRVPTSRNLMTHGQPEPRPGAEHSALERRPLLRGRPSHPTPSTRLPHGGLRPRPAVGGSEATDAAAAAGDAPRASREHRERPPLLSGLGQRGSAGGRAGRPRLRHAERPRAFAVKEARLGSTCQFQTPVPSFLQRILRPPGRQERAPFARRTPGNGCGKMAGAPRARRLRRQQAATAGPTRTSPRTREGSQVEETSLAGALAHSACRRAQALGHQQPAAVCHAQHALPAEAACPRAPAHSTQLLEEFH